MRRSAIEYIESKHLRQDVTDFRTGDSVRVHWKVKEGEKERVQAFEGIFPLHSPRYEKIEILTRGNVNRNRLFYLRDLRGKASRVDTQDENAPTTTEGKKATKPTTGA
jgi:large subunit ribosomal protein L19